MQVDQIIFFYILFGFGHHNIFVLFALNGSLSHDAGKVLKKVKEAVMRYLYSLEKNPVFLHEKEVGQNVRNSIHTNSS